MNINESRGQSRRTYETLCANYRKHLPRLILTHRYAGTENNKNKQYTDDVSTSMESRKDTLLYCTIQISAFDRSSDGKDFPVGMLCAKHFYQAGADGSGGSEQDHFRHCFPCCIYTRVDECERESSKRR
jgi:hypothetical protein